MLEELGQPYDLRFVDLMKGEQRTPEFRALNPMGKIPLLVDGEAKVTESAAIAIYLADRYGLGTLAPRLDEPERGTYLRWILFAPAVIEPGSIAKASNWEFRAGQVGWGDYESMLETMEAAIGDGPWLLGDRFTMADVVFGGTVSYMLKFKMLEPRPRFTAYAERLSARPAFQAAEAKNAAIVQERGLSR